MRWFLLVLFLIGCNRDAQVASYNLSHEGDMFRLNRRIVFYNGITGDYMLSIQGRCSIEKDERQQQLEVTCRTGKDSYRKHFLGISDNVTYFVEQLKSKGVSRSNYKVLFKPTTIIPDIELTK
jgi:hypothetical protein